MPDHQPVQHYMRPTASELHFFPYAAHVNTPQQSAVRSSTAHLQFTGMGSKTVLVCICSAFITSLIKSKRVSHFWMLCLCKLNMSFRPNAGATSNAVICRCDAIHSAAVGRVHRRAVEAVHRLRHIRHPHVTMYQLFHLIDSVGVLPVACVVHTWWIMMHAAFHNAVDCLEQLVSKMTYCVSSGSYNHRLDSAQGMGCRVALV